MGGETGKQAGTSWLYGYDAWNVPLTPTVYEPLPAQKAA